MCFANCMTPLGQEEKRIEPKVTNHLKERENTKKWFKIR